MANQKTSQQNISVEDQENPVQANKINKKEKEEIMKKEINNTVEKEKEQVMENNMNNKKIITAREIESSINFGFNLENHKNQIDELTEEEYTKFVDELSLMQLELFYRKGIFNYNERFYDCLNSCNKANSHQIIRLTEEAMVSDERLTNIFEFARNLLKSKFNSIIQRDPFNLNLLSYLSDDLNKLENHIDYIFLDNKALGRPPYTRIYGNYSDFHEGQMPKTYINNFINKQSERYEDKGEEISLPGGKNE